VRCNDIFSLFSLFFPCPYFNFTDFGSLSTGEQFPEIIQNLIPTCKRLAETGTPKQAKQSIRCLYVNVINNQDQLFSEIIEVFEAHLFLCGRRADCGHVFSCLFRLLRLFQRIKENLDPASEHYRTAIVALGHIAYNLPDKNPVQIKNIVSRKVRIVLSSFIH